MLNGKPLNAGEKKLGKLFGDMGGSGGPPKKPMPPEAGDEPDADEEELPAGFEDAASEFLDETLPMPERLKALKRAIHACTAEY